MPFVPGQSGNPSGRPKADPILREMAQARTAEAFQVVLDALADPDKRIALKAAEIVLDRGHGKPAQAVELANAPGETFKTEEVRRTIVDPRNTDS